MKFMKEQKVLRSKANKAEKAPELLNTANPETEHNDDLELTDDQLDVVSGGTINPGMAGDDDDIFE